MKQISKKLISIVLSVAMVLTMVPVIPGLSSEAYAVEAGNLWVGGVKMTDGKYLAEGKTTTTSTKPSGGYAYYKDGVLTLNDYTYTGAGYVYDSYEYDDGELEEWTAALYSDGNINIKLIGVNEIIGTDDVLGANAVGVISDGGVLSVSGGGILSVTGDEYGIFAEEINIQDAEVYAYAKEVDALSSYSDINISNSIVYAKILGDGFNSIVGNNINIENSTVYAYATNAEAIYTIENLSIVDGSMVLANSEYYDGIYVYQDMDVVDSEVNAGGYYNGIYIEDGDLYVDNSEVYGISYEDELYGGINLEYGDVYTDETVLVSQDTVGTNAEKWDGETSLNEYTYVCIRNTDKLLAPTNVKVNNVASSGAPKVTWNAVEGADKYEIWRKVGSSGTYAKYDTTTGPSYTNSSTTPGTIYYYKVKAICSAYSASNSELSKGVYIARDLPQPTNVKIAPVASSGAPKVTWDAVEGASKYEIYRKVGSSGTYAKYDTTTGTSYTNSSTTPGTIYYYKVLAVCGTNSGGNSALSKEVYIARDLPQPTNVKIAPVASSGAPKVTWDAVEGASKYEIYRKVGSSGTYAKYDTTTGTSYTNSSTTPGTIYYYKVLAVCGTNSGGNSALSKEVYIARDLPQPTNVKIAPVVETGKPKVTWDGVEGASKYEIWRKVGSSGTYAKYDTTTGTSYINSSTTPGTIYYYKVLAVCGTNSGGNSALSKEVYMACDLAQPQVSIALSSAGKPKVSWKAVSGASKYEIWRKVGSTGTYAKYDTTTNTSYTNTSATAGTTYYYQIKAICSANSGGNSAKSTAVSITSK